jgi:hypothetical protein
MSDDNLVDEILAIILRRDGSIRYDRMRRDNLEDLLPAEAWDDSGIDTVLELTAEGVFHPLREPLGNIGVELFASSREKLSLAKCGIGISNSRYNIPLIQAIGITIADLEKREPRALDAELLVHDPEGNSILLQDIMGLEVNCSTAGKDKNQREECRQLYWKLWEFAWARRIFVAEDHIIETLENLYTRYPFLDTRLGQRRAPAPPGDLTDPRLEEECNEPELF